MSVKPIPEGFHTLTPNLVCKNAVGAIDFYIESIWRQGAGAHGGPERRDHARRVADR